MDARLCVLSEGGFTIASTLRVLCAAARMSSVHFFAHAGSPWSTKGAGAHHMCGVGAAEDRSACVPYRNQRNSLDTYTAQTRL
jgi:hypothetical protein